MKYLGKAGNYNTMRKLFEFIRQDDRYIYIKAGDKVYKLRKISYERIGGNDEKPRNKVTN